MLRLSREQVREVDRIAIEEYGIPGIVLMENAARAVADAALKTVSASKSGFVTVICGGGNNGGDGFAVARHLHNHGVEVGILKAWQSPLRGDALTNWQIVQCMGLHMRTVFDETGRNDHPSDWDQEMLDGPALVIDALFGTGLQEPPRGNFVDLVEIIESWGPKVLSIDLPSGLDCDTGEPLGDACIKADLTVTFVAEKLGFANPKSRHYTGEIVVGDIGCPREIIDRVLQEIPAPPLRWET